MGVGVRIAVIAILIIVAGTFLLVASHAPKSHDGGGPTPTPDPDLRRYIEAVRQASAALSETTNNLLSLTSKLPPDLDASFALHNHRVNSSSATAARKEIDTYLVVLSRKLNAYADIVNKFDHQAQAWTASTAQYAILNAKPDSDGLISQIVDPMAAFSTISGLLSTFVSTWKSAYTIATVAVDSNMSHVLDKLSEGANVYSSQSVLDYSPYEASAKKVYSTYMALFNNIVGV